MSTQFTVFCLVRLNPVFPGGQGLVSPRTLSKFCLRIPLAQQCPAVSARLRVLLHQPAPHHLAVAMGVDAEGLKTTNFRWENPKIFEAYEGVQLHRFDHHAGNIQLF